jgi:hypothetical protein
MHNALTESMDMDANAASNCGRKLFLEFKHDADITPVYGELVRPAGLGVMVNLMVVMTTWTCSGVLVEVACPIPRRIALFRNRCYTSKCRHVLVPSRFTFGA